MGLFDVFKKKEVVKEYTVNIEELLSWANKRFLDELVEEQQKINQLQSSLQKNFLELRDSISTLSKSVFEKTDRRYSAVNMIKDSFVKKSVLLLGEIDKKETEMKYTFIKEFYDRRADILKEFNNINPKQAMLLTHYFPRENQIIVGIIKKIEHDLAELNTLISSKTSKMRLFDIVSSELFNRQNLMKELRAVNEKIEGFNSRETELAGIIEKEINKLTEITEGGEWGTLEQAKAEVQTAKRECEELRFALVSYFSSCMRPLRKLEHLHGTKTLNRLLNNTLETLLEEDLSRIKEIIEELVNYAREGKIELNEKERRMVYSLLNKIDSDIPAMRKRYIDLSEREKEARNKLEEMYSKFLRSKQEHESIINTCKKELETIKINIGQSEKAKEELMKNISDKKRMLENMVSDASGLKITIKANL